VLGSKGKSCERGGAGADKKCGGKPESDQAEGSLDCCDVRQVPGGRYNRFNNPDFAPNGRMILYASLQGGRGILAAVSNDGRIKQRVTSSSGDVREPAWGPMQKGL
jgi:hypothetical protein